MEAGIPVIPIYNGDECSLKDIKDHVDGKVEGLGEYQELIR